jgi:hypothetical protein
MVNILDCIYMMIYIEIVVPPGCEMRVKSQALSDAFGNIQLPFFHVTLPIVLLLASCFAFL